MPLIIPYSFGTAGLNTPTTQLDGDFSAISNWINARNPASGNLAARPAAGNAGALYIATDQQNQLFMDSGTAWLTIGVPYATLVGQSPPAAPATGSGIFFTQLGTGLQAPTWIDDAGQVREISSRLFSQSGPALTGAAETSCFTTAPVVRGSSLVSPRVIALLLSGDIASPAALTLTFRLKFGGFTINSASQTFSASSNSSIRIAIEIINISTGQVVAEIMDIASANVTATTYSGVSSYSVNVNVDQTLDWTAQWSAAGNTFTTRNIQGWLR
jgi:hypothetical protein